MHYKMYRSHKVQETGRSCLGIAGSCLEAVGNYLRNCLKAVGCRQKLLGQAGKLSGVGRSYWGRLGSCREAAGNCLGSLFVNHLEHQPPLQVLLGNLGAPGVPIFAHLERVPLSEGL